jgi:hypothetical protein
MASTIKHSVSLLTRLSGDRSLVPAFPSFLHSLRFLFATLLSIHARSFALELEISFDGRGGDEERSEQVLLFCSAEVDQSIKKKLEITLCF